MDYNFNTDEERTLNIVNTANLTKWNGDSRACEQGQVIYQTLTTPTNMNELVHQSTEKLTNQNQAHVVNAQNPVTDNERVRNTSPPPMRFTFANSQTIRTSLSSSSESSDSAKTTWSKVKAGSPTKSRKDSIGHSSDEKNSPDNSPTKNKNDRGAVMTSWKTVSPTKSSSSSDLEHSNHSCHSNNSTGCPGNRIFRFTHRMKELTDSTSSSDAEPGTPKKYAKRDTVLTNQNRDGCKCSPQNDGHECENKGSCNCSKNCNSHNGDGEKPLESSTSSLCENNSPKRDKSSPDEPCDNDYYYEDDFTVQFDTNLREASVTPSDADPNTTILDFPNMVTGSYLCFNNGGSSNVSFNNSKASSNLSLNNMRGSNILNNVEDQRHGQYDSEFSGNSGSHNSTMEVSSSERDMMGSSDIIDLSDGPLFTPTPSNLLSTDSLDKGHKGGVQGADAEMSGSNGSGSEETNLNVDCCPKKEEYFLSFDGSHSKVSGSETDISLSMTSHDSCHGHWAPSETSGNSDCLHHTDGQEESTDSFHMCFNKLSPLHKTHQYSARENLSGRVLKKLIPLKEMIVESGDTSEEENVKTSPTLTAGSKDLPTLSSGSQVSPKVTLKRENDPVVKLRGVSKKKEKSENLYLVGIGKPVDILRKASVHSHTLPRMKNLVSWKQLKNVQSGKKEETKCVSLPELNNSTSWSSIKCRKLSEVSESFHNKRHSASLFDFYQRMKSQSNPVSPETMSNLEQILWPNFINQKPKGNQDMSDSSTSSAECSHCQCHRQTFNGGIPDSVTKAYTNKRIFDWLKMECSSSSRDSNRPNSLACQTANIHECFNKETIISPQTVTLWCGTKTVGSQFPPVTKDSCMQTLQDTKSVKDLGHVTGIGKRDQALQTSDFEEEEILSILSENFDDFNFLKSNEGIATKDILSISDKTFVEPEVTGRKIHRSKSADNYRRPSEKKGCVEGERSYPGRESRSTKIGRSRSAGRLNNESQMRRMNLSKHYSVQSLPDIGFLSSSVTLEKDESKDSLFDPMKINLPVPVTIATKTELEKFNIYQQKVNPCHRSIQGCEQCHVSKKTGVKGQTELGESSSGISSSSASSGIDPGYCDCKVRSNESPETDLERLIFYPPHTELLRVSKSCCMPKKKSQSAPNRLSECASSKIAGTSLEVKYANEMHPKMVPGSKSQTTGRISQKWANITLSKNVDTESNENLYALEEEQTPVASPEQHCCHRNLCITDCCPATAADGKRTFYSGEHDFTESDFYRAVGKDKIIVVENDVYRGIPMNIDSTSSSGSSVPNSDRKPLKSCLRKKNRGLRSRSLSAADNLNLNFEDMEEKVKNRHSYACDEVYIVSDEQGQLMMYQADDSAEPVMFYLGKDGECHMTEGARNHHENFGNFANFDIQATDSIHSSNSSTERDGTSKRKSVSFASEVSFQSISPAVSPRKVATADVEGAGEVTAADGDAPCKDEPVVDEQKEETGDHTTTDNKNTDNTATTPGTNQEEGSGCHDNQGSSSSSDSAPEIFEVAMDTNENLWTEDMMIEKRDMLMNVSSASEMLIAHFAKSTDTFDKLRLGNSSESPEIGELVITRLCSALTVVIGNGLRPHLAGFQMFGRVQLTVWKLVEASVEIVPQTRSLSDLVYKVKQTTYLTTHRQKFDAFIFGLLNLRLLDFWVGYISQKEDHLTRFYNPEAILVHSNSTLQKHYSDMLISLQPLSVLPFQLNLEFLKSDDMIGSKDCVSDPSANQDPAYKSTGGNSESTNETLPPPMEVTSVLELTASKALTWLAKATLPKRSSMSDSRELSQSRSKSFDTAERQLTDSDKTRGKLTGSVSYTGDEKDLKSSPEKIVEKLTDSQKHVYTDAKSSRVDCDNLLPPSESLKLSTSLISSRSESQSLTQSMTSSASSLVSKLMQFGSSLTQKQTTYKKGVTEYSFESEQPVDDDPASSESSQKLAVKGQVGSEVQDCKGQEEQSKEFIEEVRLREKKVDKAENTSAKRVSFDIVNLFDKLLMPSKPADKKVTSRIPVPTNRWSWNFGPSKPTAPASTAKVQKTATKSDSEIAKREHYPKKSVQQNDSNGKSRKSPATGRQSSVNAGRQSSVNAAKQNRNAVKSGAPPKPPRLIGSPDGSKRNRNITNSLPAGSTRIVQYDINKNTATL